jgi:PKD repeat protein
VYAVANTTWSETGINWTNAPAITGSALVSSTAPTLNAYVDIPLPTSAVVPGNLVTFGLKGTGTNSLIVQSREGANKPQLVINSGGGTPGTPVGAFNASPSSGPAPLTVSFTDQSTGGPTSWAWDFGDPGSGSDNTSTIQNPLHTYASPGTYTVTLTPSNAVGTGTPATRTITVTDPPTGGSNVLVGAGDIADCGRTTDESTAQLLDGIAGTVFVAGDGANPSGTATQYSTCYGSTWGRHKDRTRPAIGDNDYLTSGASGYFGYFGSAAGTAGQGWYSFDMGGWHVVVLNSECSAIGGCGANSPQTTWLRNDLAANSASCTVAILHEPRFTSLRTTPDGAFGPIWTALYNGGAELVLSGHRHHYERFAPQTPAGAADASFGIRQMIVGTGGVALVPFGSNVMANSQVRNATTHGVLKLTLHATSYDFQFVPISGQSFTDSGTGSCHGVPGAGAQAASASAVAVQQRQAAVEAQRSGR